MTLLPVVGLGSDNPLYNIGVVARMTGLSMATLRAWERRYSFPESDRTAGGHRLYSERDVMRLRWVKERIDEGMQTAQAINALHHQEQVGNLTRVEPPPAAPAVHPPAPSLYLPQQRRELVKALIERDLVRADMILGDALVLSSPEDLILDVIGPGLNDIGQLWKDGQINVAGEHLATNYLRQRLLMWMMSGPPPRSSNPIVLACAPNEWHEGSLLILGALLRRRSWPVAYLGQSVPLPDLAGMVNSLRPELVVLVAMTESAAASLVDWPSWMPDAAQAGRPLVGFGGHIFTRQPEWRTRLPGIYLGETFREGLANIERLLTQG